VNPGPFDGDQEQAMQAIIGWLGILQRLGQKAGPYLLLEMLLPGGTLFALLLFLYRRRKHGSGGSAEQAVAAAMRALAGIFEQRILVPVPIRPDPQRSITIRSRR
jgi:hypothetical protein